MSLTEQSNVPRIGIVISMFPELHETFILRELVALEKRGLQFDIYSLQHPRDPITIDDAIRLSENRTYYSGLFNLNTISAFFKYALKQPLTMLSTVGTTLWQGRDRPMEAVKNLAILPLSLHIVDVGEKRGVVHWHGHWANIPTTACWYISRFKQRTWSAAIHGEDIFTKNNFLQHKLDAAKFSVVCSGYFCNHLKTKIGLKEPECVHLNYHGLDPRVVQRAPYVHEDKDEFSLISIGRLVPTKGHDVLIKALPAIQARLPKPVKLKLIGSGPIEQELKDLSVSQGVEDNIEFCGAVDFEQVLEMLESSDLFCLAPRMIPGHPPDGIPNVIAEAMALGVPVVTTRVSAIPELVEDGVTGRMVEVDDVESFADAVVSTIENSETRDAMGVGAREKVGELFNQDVNIDELLELFDRYVPETAECFSKANAA